jgi:hypothetical protein
MKYLKIISKNRTLRLAIPEISIKHTVAFHYFYLTLKAIFKIMMITNSRVVY